MLKSEQPVSQLQLSVVEVIEAPGAKPMTIWQSPAGR
jgi:hypothetical protein